MKCRVVYKPDKTVAVLIPALNSRRVVKVVVEREVDNKIIIETELQFEEENVWQERVFTKMMQEKLSGLPYDDIDSSELPSRAFRYQWRGEKGKGITLDDTVLSETEQLQQDWANAQTADEKIQIMAERFNFL